MRASGDWDKRKGLLSIGQAFSVVQDAFGPAKTSFEKGERLTLRTVTYSHYDNSHVYTFETPEGEAKSYWLHDDEPATRLTSTFTC